MGSAGPTQECGSRCGTLGVRLEIISFPALRKHHSKTHQAIKYVFLRGEPRKCELSLFIFRQFCSKHINVILEADASSIRLLLLTLALLRVVSPLVPGSSCPHFDHSFSAVAQGSWSRAGEKLAVWSLSCCCLLKFPCFQ